MATTQPRKQRSALYSAPLHARHRYMSAPLSKELRGKHKTRSLPVRKGDRVRIVSGDFKKHEGEVVKVDTKFRCIQIEGTSVAKADGTQVPSRIKPSNVVILKLVEDRERARTIERRSKSG